MIPGINGDIVPGKDPEASNASGDAPEAGGTTESAAT